MGREKKGTVKRSVSFAPHIFEYITEEAAINGIAFSAQMNMMLREGKEIIESRRSSQADNIAADEHPVYGKREATG